MEIKIRPGNVHPAMWMIMRTKEEKVEEGGIMAENICRLRVSKVQLRDRGFYHCQLATHPPQVVYHCLFVSLLVSFCVCFCFGAIFIFIMQLGDICFVIM